MKILLIRHGEADHSGHLNEVGCEQMRRLSTRVKDMGVFPRVRLFSSKAPRAFKSAMFMSDVLGVDPEADDFFFSNDATDMTVKVVELYELVQEHEGKTDMIVIISHLEVVRDFPAYYLDMAFGKRFTKRESEHGKGWVIDCDAGTAERFAT